jgi:hypothetical protein
MEQQPDVLSNDLTVNNITQEYFLASAKWGKFLAIAGFVFCGLMVILSFFISALLSSTMSTSMTRFNPASLTFIYIILAAMLFFPCLYLFKFSTNMIDAITNNRQDSFDSSAMNLKSMFKFYGIFTIVILGFYALAIIFGIMGSLMR